MGRAFLFFCILVANAMPGAWAGPVSGDLSRYAPAVVTVEVRSMYGSSSGTGFFSSPDGEMITNYHVMGAVERDPSAAVAFHLADGSVVRDYRIGKCSARYGVDLCVLKLPVYPKAYFRVGAGDSDAGLRVGLIGNPGGSGLRGYSGAVLGNLDVDNVPHVALSIELVPGMSGSPIFSSDGRLIAVATLWMQDFVPVLRAELQPGEKRYLAISGRKVADFQREIREFLPVRAYYSPSR